MTTADLTAGPEQRGRTRITSRALDRVVSRVTADAFGVDEKKVSLDIEDARGNLSLRVKTPLRVPSLDDIGDEPATIERGGGPILDRANRAQESIRHQIEQITGSTVDRVIVEITGADMAPQKRVK